MAATRTSTQEESPQPRSATARRKGVSQMVNHFGPDDDSEMDLPADASLEALADDEDTKSDKDKTAVEEENEGMA